MEHIATGIKSLDEVLGGGLRRGSLTVIAARPGMGKTALAMQIAAGFAVRGGKGALIFSPGFPSDKYIRRVVSQLSGVDGYQIEHGILTDREREAVEAAKERVGKAGMTVYDDPQITAGVITGVIGLTAGPGPIVVDPADAVFGEGDGSAAAEMLKDAAHGAGVAVVCCVEMPRRIEQRKDKRPALTDLMPVCLRQAADVVILPYRESYYAPLSVDRSAEIRVVTSGEEHVVPVTFDPSAVKFDRAI